VPTDQFSFKDGTFYVSHQQQHDLFINVYARVSGFFDRLKTRTEYLPEITAQMEMGPEAESGSSKGQYILTPTKCNSGSLSDPVYVVWFKPLKEGRYQIAIKVRFPKGESHTCGKVILSFGNGSANNLTKSCTRPSLVASIPSQLIITPKDLRYLSTQEHLQPLQVRCLMNETLTKIHLLAPSDIEQDSLWEVLSIALFGSREQSGFLRDQEMTKLQKASDSPKASSDDLFTIIQHIADNHNRNILIVSSLCPSKVITIRGSGEKLNDIALSHWAVAVPIGSTGPFHLTDQFSLLSRSDDEEEINMSDWWTF